MVTIAKLWTKTGGLSDPSKMPGFAWSIPSKKCKRGSALRKIPGTVCYMCFACKGRYVFDNVQNALAKRLANYLADPLAWQNAMVQLLWRKALNRSEYFRWFDSGDVQSVEMLIRIGQIAKKIPVMKFWLPTRELGMVREAMRRGWKKPDNLCIRISEDMVGKVKGDCGFPTSSVDANEGWLCPASRGEVTCAQANCYRCWDETVENVDYKGH